MSVYKKKRSTYSARLFKTLTGAPPIKIGRLETSEDDLSDGSESGVERTQKGALYGKCNVTACQKPRSALFYNKAMMAFYCHHCASEIRRFNQDSPDLFPHFTEELDAYFYATRSDMDHITVRNLFDVPQGVHALF